MRTWMMRRVAPVALIAAAGAALSFAISYQRPQTPTNADQVSAATANSQSSGVRDRAQSAIAAVKNEAKDVAAALAAPPASPGDEPRPAFDVARIEPSGDAVIAGRAAPGASVELLRDGKLHDRVVADRFGQFAMVPPRLPPGDYELTLRSRLPDGTDATSKDSVVVALQPNRQERPVVALMRPDKPSIVLSKP